MYILSYNVKNKIKKIHMLGNIGIKERIFHLYLIILGKLGTILVILVYMT